MARHAVILVCDMRLFFSFSPGRLIGGRRKREGSAKSNSHARRGTWMTVLFRAERKDGRWQTSGSLDKWCGVRPARALKLSSQCIIQAEKFSFRPWTENLFSFLLLHLRMYRSVHSPHALFAFARPPFAWSLSQQLFVFYQNFQVAHKASMIVTLFPVEAWYLESLNNWRETSTV